MLLLLALIYLLPGLVGHDPWKQDETYVTSIIYHLAQTEDWIVPHSAGVPFVEKPPLYFLVAEEAADLLAPWLPLHDAARLTNVLWILIVLGCLALAARRAWPQVADPSAASMLTLLSCIGLLIHAHSLVVDVALLAGFAIALLGFCSIRDQPVRGGLLLGTGAGLGFLAKGLLAPGCLGVTALLLPALFAPWRTRAYARGLAIAATVALPWLVVWPAALYLRAPELFAHWFWQENLGRFLGYAHLGADPPPWYYAKTLPWFAFPALPLALWTLWRRRALWRHDPALQLCVVLAVVIVATLSIAGSMRDLYLLPVLLPLSLLAVGELEALPQGMQRLSATAAYTIYGALAIVLWVMCLLIALNGAPPAWLPLDRLLPPSFVPRARPWALTVAVLVSLAWLAATRWSNRTRLAGVLGWTLGLTLTWVLVATLWMPWINAAKSYRAMFEDMREHLPPTFDCINSMHLGESEAAMLEYEGGIVAIPVVKYAQAQCELLWIQSTQLSPAAPPTADWSLLWSGHRPGDRKELHALYTRVTPNGQPRIDYTWDQHHGAA